MNEGLLTPNTRPLNMNKHWPSEELAFLCMLVYSDSKRACP